MRRYGLVDIPDSAEDIDAVPITRTLTINGTTYDLSANRTWTIPGTSIGETITGGTTGSVLFIGASSVLAQDNANFFWDDTNNRLGIATNTPAYPLTVNGSIYSTGLNIGTGGSAASYSIEIGSSRTGNGYAYIDLTGDATYTDYGFRIIRDNIGANSTSRLWHRGTGNFELTTIDAAAIAFFTTNTRRMTLTASGRLLIGHSTEDVYILDVQSANSRFGGTTNYTVLYSQANGGGIGLFKSDILLSNLIQNELYIDPGIVTGDPIRIYVTDFLTPGTARPLCINGNGRETIFGSDTTTNTASSLVTLSSTTKGFLPPRMTSAQRTAIASPATGLLVYQTDGSNGLYLRNSGAWVLLGTGTGNGTVTSVSVVTANGFAGTVATSTTTPAITLTTTITGMLKGDGTAISAAVSNTDYQAPITLTTTGSSGAASFSGTTLNIPNYSSSAPTNDGTYTPTISSQTNCGNFTTYQLQYFEVGNMVHVAGKINFSPNNTTSTFGFKMSIPVNANLSTDYYCGGTCVRELSTTAGTVSAGSIQGGGNNLVEFFFATANSTAITDWFFTYTYYVSGT